MTQKLCDEPTPKPSRMCLCRECGEEMGRGVIEKHYREAHPERYAEKAREPGFGAQGLGAGETRWWMFGKPREGEVI